MPAGNCEECGTHRRWLHKHRVIMGCDGGEYVEDNVRLVCANCHEDIHDGPMGGKSVAHRRYSAQANARRAEAMRERWADPEYKARMEARKTKPRRLDYGRMQALRKEGFTKQEVADALGCSRGAVERALGIVGDPGSAAASQQRRREREK